MGEVKEREEEKEIERVKEMRDGEERKGIRGRERDEEKKKRS